MQTEFKKEPEKQLTSPDKLEPLKLNSNKLLEQRPRSSGFKSFLNWFKKVENLQRSTEDNSSSLSSSDEESSDSSTSSTATVASFAFLPANVYKPYGDAKQPEKFIAPGPYTETYRKLILERNRRRNLDKNLSLRKKYSLYSSGTLGSKLEMHVQAPKKLDHNENIDNVQVYDTFSLPSIAKKGLIGLDNFKDNRRTASLSSRDNKTPNYCHVKGKRKAPQPPINPEFVRSNRKKRQAPAPPKQFIENNKMEENKTNQDNQSSVIPVNLLLNQDKDKSGFDPDILKNKQNFKNELSPKPWYKRQSSENKSKQKNSKNDSNKKKNKHEYPEIGFFRYSRIFENKKLSYSDNSEQDNKQDKRASCLLPNISELDREAAEIIKHKKDLENQCNGGNNVEDIAANKPSSARDLINKFNALTNATNAPLAPSNIVLSKVEEKKVDMKSPIAIISRKFYKGVIDDDSKINNHNKLKNYLNETNTNLTSNQTDLLKVPKTEVFGARKICTTCYNQNNTSGNTCINCIKSQLDKIEANNQDNQNISKTSNSESSKSFQAEVFSAIPNFNFPLNKTSIINDENISTKENAFERSSQALKKISDSEEKIRLREMLKEMKNSLPKRPKPEKPINGSKAEADSKPRDKLIIASESPGIEKLSAHCDKDILPIVKTGQVSAITDKFTSNENEVLNSKKVPEKSDIAKGKVLGSEQIRNRDVMVSKVSSSAQTNCISKKTDLILNAQKQTVLEKVEEKNSNENISNQLYMNIEESKMLASKGKNSDSQMNVNTKLLLKQLEAAIAQGNDLLAAKLAKDLALLKVNCSVTSTYTIQLKENNKQSVQIYIEDQFSHQGPIPLKVEGNITIAGLKSQVSKELHIPAGVQRWIIGKQLTIDDNLPLVHYNKNNFENPLFLYVVASEPKQEKITKVENLKDLRSSAESLNKATKEEIKIDIEVSRSSVGSDKDKKINIVDEKEGDEKIKINLKNVEKKVIKPGTSKIVITNESPPLKDVVKKTWICSACTLINSLLSPLCSACGSKKPDSPDISNKSKDNASATEDKNHYLQLVNLDNSELVPNLEKFECPVCLTDCNPNAGVVLRECLHTFCKDCLANIVKFSEEAEIKCPYRDNEYFCDSVIQEREIKALVNKALYEQHLAKSVNFAENKIKNAFHCKTPDCKGWCIFEENVNDFRCPVCKKTNCLTCQAIHEGKNCKEYQEQINNDDTTSSADGQRTKQMLEDMVNKGEAMICPSCQVVLMKKWGCDWLRCSMCKTEICWVTRGPRWGPAGKGDTSGGCQCGLNGVKCHPKCNYCH